MLFSDNDVDYFVYDESEYNENWNKLVAWKEICMFCSLEMLQTFKDDIDWTAASKNPNITSELIEKHKNEIRYDLLIFSDCSLDFLKNSNKINFFWLSTNKNLNIHIARKYKDKLNWNLISRWCSIKILLEFETLINWRFASDNLNLSIKLMRKHKNDLKWDLISKWASQDVRKEFEYELKSRYC